MFLAAESGNQKTGKLGNHTLVGAATGRSIKASICKKMEKKLIKSNEDLKIPAHITQLEWALEAKKMRLAIIPTYANSKTPAIPWGNSCGLLTEEEIHRYWALHPDHEVAILTGDKLVVLDADSPAAISALSSLEYKFGMNPSIINNTRKGEHHYYRLDENVKVRAEAHSTDVHPERIDVLTGRKLVMGPGSSNKKLITWNASNFDEISVASQAFMDAVRIHNGNVDRSQPEDESRSTTPPGQYGINVLKALLEFISAEDYQVWTSVGMALFRETLGSSEGLALYEDWSRKSEKYGGRSVIEKKWRSFEGGHKRPVTIASIIFKARQGGANVSEILEGFSKISEVCPVEELVSAKKKVSPFDAYNAVPHIAALEQEVMEERIIFGGLVAMGEATAIYAEANTGKTLIILKEIVQSIRQGLVRAEDIIYINLDDPLRGFTEKTRLAQEFGFLMLGEGHQNFQSSDVVRLMKESISTGTASGKILIIDTATKVVDLMSKNESRKFSELCRSFTTVNGTVILLAHTNKNRDANNKVVYSGVSDVRNNIDCTYLMDKVTVNEAAQLKTVKFEVDKIRSSVKSFATYRYSTDPSLSYIDRLLSVELVNPEDVGRLDEPNCDRPDGACIDAIKECIGRGVNTKMKLVLEAKTKVGTSRGKMEAILKKYTGSTPSVHLWSFEKAGLNNAQIYRLLTVEQGRASGPPVSGFSGSPAPHPKGEPTLARPDFDDEENEEFEYVKF